MRRDQAQASRVGMTVKLAFSAMISRLQKRFCYLVIGYLAAGALTTGAAQYRSWQDTYGEDNMTAVLDKEDDLGSVARDLARMSGTSLNDEQMAQLTRDLARQNNITVPTNPIPAGTVLDVLSAKKQAELLESTGQSH